LKKTLASFLPFFMLFILNINIMSQHGWFWLNPLPQGNTITGLSSIGNNTFYFSSFPGALFKSTNGGFNFTKIPTNVDGELSARFINESTGFSSGSGGILRTTDGGFNWVYLPGPVNGVSVITDAPFNTLYSLTGNQIYKSTDLGNSWHVSLTPAANTTINRFHFADEQIGYAVGRKPILFQNSKIYRTTNAGASWDSVTSTLRNELRSVFFFNANTGFTTFAVNFTGKFLRTTNGCLSWDTISTVNNFSDNKHIEFFNSLEGYMKTGNSYAVTTNGGHNWSQGAQYLDVVFSNINTGIAIGAPYSYNRIFTTVNSGLNWIQVTPGFSGRFYDITFIDENTGFTADYNIILKTSDGGISWSNYNLNLSGWSEIENIMFVNENTGYAGIYGRVAKTTNCGADWTVYTTGINDHNHGMSFPSVDTGYIVTKYGHYLKTTNAGVNWLSLGEVPTHGLGDIVFVNNTTGFAAGDSSIYLGANRGFIRRTTNGGLNWNMTFIDSVNYFYDACTSNDVNWFAAGARVYDLGGIIVGSTNAGISWSEHYFPSYISAIHFPSVSTGFASSLNGIMYKTTNAGENWFPTQCVSNENLYGLYFINDNTGFGVNDYGHIIKTTTGGGVLIGIEPVTTETPVRFSLSQNYPNPFNPVTKIKFDLPLNADVKLIVYDILGREVRRLVESRLNPGTYNITFDGTNLASGVYFYRLIANGFSKSRVMVLIK
jgi:photosystem II stability/assembly factor-like uncharacterized protein